MLTDNNVFDSQPRIKAFEETMFHKDETTNKHTHIESVGREKHYMYVYIYRCRGFFKMRGLHIS